MRFEKLKQDADKKGYDIDDVMMLTEDEQDIILGITPEDREIEHILLRLDALDVRKKDLEEEIRLDEKAIKEAVNYTIRAERRSDLTYDTGLLLKVRKEKEELLKRLNSLITIVDLDEELTDDLEEKVERGSR